MLKGFRDFISRGNVIDLAVAVIIGAAFTPIVNAVSNLITQLIASIIGKPSFDNVLEFTINGTLIQPGTIITAIVNFLLIAGSVYFVIVLPMNKFKERQAAKEAVEEAAAEPSAEIQLLTEIRDALTAKN
ncbi:large conductance mechanosensitive channel protein MscL [Schaalia sp. lx-100]|nr:large conductance mechanosensitive channel protein MscL [Schaalia sp. lx-100]MCD4557621.1 large conductance mechanosensitive channel protein MscL [Schaalia sp. lx-100]